MENIKSKRTASIVFQIFKDWDEQGLKYIVVLGVIFLCSLDFSFRVALEPYFLFSANSLIFIAIYNNRRSTKLKHFFYVYYPLHLIVLHLPSVSLLKIFL